MFACEWCFVLTSVLATVSTSDFDYSLGNRLHVECPSWRTINWDGWKALLVVWSSHL